MNVGLFVIQRICLKKWLENMKHTPRNSKKHRSYAQWAVQGNRMEMIYGHHPNVLPDGCTGQLMGLTCQRVLSHDGHWQGRTVREREGKKERK